MNYPEGFNHRLLDGPDFEGEAEVRCTATGVVMVLVSTEVHQWAKLARQTLDKADWTPYEIAEGIPAKAWRRQLIVALSIYDDGHEELELDECGFEGTADVTFENGYNFWVCPRCGSSQMDEVDMSRDPDGDR